MATGTRDYRQELTNQIIELVEKGAAPWQKPWSPADGHGLSMPHNAVSGRPYRGGNALYLMMQQQGRGSDDPRWCTYKQAQAEGWQVRKGEKGTSVEYWKFDEERETTREDGTVKKERVKLERPHVFYANVFHASQIDGMPPHDPARAKKAEWEVSQAAEAAIAASGVPFFHDQADNAFYTPSRDQIHTPPRSAFKTPADYYEVALHELGHATVHPSRLNRDLSGGFGSTSYAREELRAQMCSLYLSAELGLPFNPDRHAAYQASWLDALKNDKNEFFRAARDAESMADYVIDLSHKKELEQTYPGLNADIALVTNDNQEWSFSHYHDYHGSESGQSLEESLRAQGFNSIKDITGSDINNVYVNAHNNLSKIYGPDSDDVNNAYLEKKGLAQAFAESAFNIIEHEQSLNMQRALNQNMEMDAQMDLPPELPLGHIPVMSIHQEREYRTAKEKGDEIKAGSIQLEASRNYREEAAAQLPLQEIVRQRGGEQARMHLAQDNKRYAGPVLAVNEKYALQSSMDGTAFVAHPIDKFKSQGIELTPGKAYSIRHNGDQLAVDELQRDRKAQARGQGQEQGTQGTTDGQEGQGKAKQQDKGNAINSEVSAMHKAHAPGSKLVMAQDRPGTAYTGTIIAETGDKVLQRVSDKYVVVHNKSMLARDVEVGSTKRLAYENGRIDVLEPSMERNHSRYQEAQRAGEVAPDQRDRAKAELAAHYGADAKLRSAKTDIGDYKGKVVSVSDTQVIQQVGAKSFVAHDRANLTGPATPGKYTQIKYADGKAEPSLAEPTRGRANALER